MKITLYTDDLQKAPVDAVALGVFADEPDRGFVFSELNRALDGTLEEACREEGFKAKPGQVVAFNAHGRIEARRVFVLGLGDRRPFTVEAARHYAGTAVQHAAKAGAKAVALQLPFAESGEEEEGGAEVLRRVQALAEGVELGSYRFDEYRTQNVEPSKLAQVRIAFVAEDVRGVKGTALRTAIQDGQAVAEGVALGRDLTNLPPNILTPINMADRAKKMAKAAGLTCKVLDVRDLTKQAMHLHLGVGRGSVNEPRLIHLTHAPEKTKSDRVIALVGKGITFDAGGLSIKTSEGMTTMKIDMGGAAAVIGAMKAIASLGLGITVHGLIGAAENMPDGNAIRPGDVLPSKKGLTVEVLNTDAEGRLVLADVLAYAQTLKVTDIVDLATLTGAAMVALGRLHAAAYCRGEQVTEEISEAYNRSGELFWPMPLAQELRPELDSDIADIKNIADRWGGSITAALFLGAFVDDDVRWAHLDIAGPVLATKDRGYIPKGGTGFAVRTLVEYAKLLTERD